MYGMAESQSGLAKVIGKDLREAVGSPSKGLAPEGAAGALPGDASDVQKWSREGWSGPAPPGPVARCRRPPRWETADASGR